MRGQPAAIAGSTAGLAVRLAPDDRLGLFMGGVEHALGDLHVLQGQSILIGAQLLGLRAELRAPQIAEHLLQPAAGPPGPRPAPPTPGPGPFSLPPTPPQSAVFPPNP